MPLVRQCDLQALLWCQELSPTNEDLLCGVCLSLFDRRRVVLHCSHSFCQACVAHLRRPVRDGAVVTCPLCRLVSPFSAQNPLEPNRELHRQLIQTKRRAYTHQVLQWIPIPEPLQELIKARSSSATPPDGDFRQPTKRRRHSSHSLRHEHTFHPSVELQSGGDRRDSVADLGLDKKKADSSRRLSVAGEPELATKAEPEEHPASIMHRRRGSSAVSVDPGSDSEHRPSQELPPQQGPGSLRRRRGHHKRKQASGPAGAELHQQEQRKHTKLQTSGVDDLSKKPRSKSCSMDPDDLKREGVVVSAARRLRQELLAIAMRKNVRLRCVFKHPEPALLGFQLPGLTPQQQQQQLREAMHSQAHLGLAEDLSFQQLASVQNHGEDPQHLMQQRAIARSYETELALCPACGVNHLRADRLLQRLRQDQPSGTTDSQSDLAQEIALLEQASLREVWSRDSVPMLELRGRWIDVADAKQQMLVVLREHRDQAQQRRSLWNRLWSWVRQTFGCYKSKPVATTPDAEVGASHGSDVHKNPPPQEEDYHRDADDDGDDDDDPDHEEFEIEDDQDDDEEVDDMTSSEEPDDMDQSDILREEPFEDGMMDDEDDDDIVIGEVSSQVDFGSGAVSVAR